MLWFNFREKIYKSNVTLLKLNKSFNIIQDNVFYLIFEESVCENNN